MKFKSFKEVMEKKIIPFHNKNSNFIRLDGLSTGGNRKVFAYFDYNGIMWKIHSDTHFSELDKAYNKIIQGEDPFKISETNKGNICLVLKSELANKPKHLYIYFNKKI